MGGQIYGWGGFGQVKAVGDQAAHVQLAAEYEPGDFALEGEIGGITAQKVLFIDADAGEVGGPEDGGGS